MVTAGFDLYLRPKWNKRRYKKKKKLTGTVPSVVAKMVIVFKIYLEMCKIHWNELRETCPLLMGFDKKTQRDAPVPTMYLLN